MTTSTANPRSNRARVHASIEENSATPARDVEIVIPVTAGRRELAPVVGALHQTLNDGFPFSSAITIADAASTDGAWDIAKSLARVLPGVGVVRVADHDRGRALARAALASHAGAVLTFDLDEPIDPTALAPLVAPLLSGHSEVAIGTRGGVSRHGEAGRRPIAWWRRATTRAALGVWLSGAPSSALALRSDAARGLLSDVQDHGGPLSRQVLALARRRGLRVFEVPMEGEGR